jgi:hypothetical protein
MIIIINISIKIKILIIITIIIITIIIMRKPIFCVVDLACRSGEVQFREW